MLISYFTILGTNHTYLIGQFQGHLNKRRQLNQHI